MREYYDKRLFVYQDKKKKLHKEWIMKIYFVIMFFFVSNLTWSQSFEVGKQWGHGLADACFLNGDITKNPIDLPHPSSMDVLEWGRWLSGETLYGFNSYAQYIKSDNDKAYLQSLSDSFIKRLFLDFASGFWLGFFETCDGRFVFTGNYQSAVLEFTSKIESSLVQYGAVKGFRGIINQVSPQEMRNLLDTYGRSFVR
jgi:hypothetical protein